MTSAAGCDGPGRSHCLKVRDVVKYLVIYEKTATGYSAYVPDLPGCVTTGPALEDVQRLIQEAIHFHLEGMREDGIPIPEPSTTAAYVEAKKPAA